MKMKKSYLTWNWFSRPVGLTALDCWCARSPSSQKFRLNIINNANTQMCWLQMFSRLWIFHINVSHGISAEQKTYLISRRRAFRRVLSYSPNLVCRQNFPKVELGTHHWLCCTSGMHGAIKRSKSVQTFQNVIYHTPGPWSHCEKDCLVVGWRLNKTVVGGEKQFWEIIGLLNSDPGRGKKLQVNTFGKEVKFLRFYENVLEQLFLCLACNQRILPDLIWTIGP